MHNRVPAGHNKGMSTNKHLFLEVSSAKLFGSSGEPIIRSPVDVEAHRELGVWSAGLRMGGAGGYGMSLCCLNHKISHLATVVG